MAEFLGNLFLNQYGYMDIEIWIEPFAGGAGAGLTLLDADIVGEVWLTEKNPALATFWRVVSEQGEALARAIERTTPDFDVWEHSREVVAAAQQGEDVDDLDVALAAFLVNRCSRSGIVHARVGLIGGKRQDGRWTMAARWNGPSLAERIRHVAGFGSRLTVDEGCGIERIRDLTCSGIEEEVVLFVDPPYIREGNQLYDNGMSVQQHRDLAEALNGCPSRWMLTYDDEPLVADDLYSQRRVLAYEIAHTANRQRVDWEYAVFSDNLAVPDFPALLKRGDVRWVHGVDRESPCAMTV